MKNIFAAICLFSLFCPPLLGEDVASKAIYQGMFSVAYLRNQSEGGETTSGTGTIISRGGMGNSVTILTNYHVVKAANEWGYNQFINVSFPAWSKKNAEGWDVISDRNDASYDLQKSYRATVTYVDPTTDLALLEIEETPSHFQANQRGADAIPASVRPMPLATEQLRRGQAVYSIGNPAVSLGLWATTTGSISSLVENPSKFQILSSGQIYSVRVIETQNPINPGDSGGPLFNDAGQLVGINVSYTPSRIIVAGNEVRLEEARLKSHAIHIDSVVRFLAEASKRGFVDFDDSHFTLRRRERTTVWDAESRLLRAKHFEEQGTPGLAWYELYRAGDLLPAGDRRQEDVSRRSVEYMARMKQFYDHVHVVIVNPNAAKMLVWVEDGRGDRFLVRCPEKSSTLVKSDDGSGKTQPHPFRRIFRQVTDEAGNAVYADAKTVTLVEQDYLSGETLRPRTIRWEIPAVK